MCWQQEFIIFLIFMTFKKIYKKEIQYLHTPHFIIFKSGPMRSMYGAQVDEQNSDNDNYKN